VRWEMRLAADISWAWRRLKHLSWRSRWIILCTLEWRIAVSCEISWTDWCFFCFSSWLSTRSSTAMWRTQSTTAWLPDNCTCPADSLQQTVDASKFPTLVGQFTQQSLCTILLWQIAIFLTRMSSSCEIFTILFNFYWLINQSISQFLEWPK